MNENKRPVLSLVLCSRNDEYMGNSRWRLETTLNYVADQVEALGLAKDVEVLVADWGSEVPLREVLRLSPAAAAIVSFMLIPPEIARPLQKDSPFPEVLALNAAARRARGKYIGRIDQDTLVGRRFLEVFFDLYEQRRQIEVPLDSALLFSNVRAVPYRFAVRCPSLSIVEQFVGRFGSNLKLEITSRKSFYKHSVGIWLLPRALWHECGGYDEEMLYMNEMEVNMIERLIQKYKLIDLGKIVGHDFYHLEHYHPWGPHRSSQPRKVNLAIERGIVFHPNDGEWGLARYPLGGHPYPSKSAIAVNSRCVRAQDRLRFALLLLLVRAQIAFDRWESRRQRAWTAMGSQPMHRWPRALVQLWSNWQKRTRDAGAYWF
jgi:hypothetical protein